MSIYAESVGKHTVSHKNLNNPKKNKNFIQEYKVNLIKNGHESVDLNVNDNGKKYYSNFNNLNLFNDQLQKNNNSLFQLAKTKSVRPKHSFKHKKLNLFSKKNLKKLISEKSKKIKKIKKLISEKSKKLITSRKLKTSRKPKKNKKKSI